MTSLASPAPRRQCATPTRKNPASLRLTAERERQLAARIQLGDQAAREELIVGNLKLVRYFANRYARSSRRSLEFDDLYQVGCEGLLIAADRFNPDRSRFGTYATFWIRQRIQRHIINHGSTIRIPAHLHYGNGPKPRLSREQLSETALTATTAGDPLDNLVDAEDLDRFRKLLLNLSRRDRDLLVWFATDYGVYGRKPNEPVNVRRNKAHAARRLIAQLKDRLNPSEGS